MTGVNKKLAATMLLLCTSKTNRTQLNKLVFFADVAWYLTNDKTITDDKYSCLPFGPVPQSVDAARMWLVTKNYLNANHDDYIGWKEYSYVVSDSVDLEKVKTELTPDQVALIQKVKNKLGGLSASALSEKSHEFKPWKDTELYSEIDLRVAKEDSELKNWLKERQILT